MVSFLDAVAKCGFLAVGLLVGGCSNQPMVGGDDPLTGTQDSGTMKQDSGMAMPPDSGMTTPDSGTQMPMDAGRGPGCGTVSLLALPADRRVKGPWPVGAKSVVVNNIVVEVWYPAALGSDTGKEKVRYDIRTDLPPMQAMKISDTDTPLQPCDCVRDLPIDATHGPYPLVVFVHGTAGFKTQNLDNAVHWASRGFVVMAANHPGLTIGSFVGGGGGQQNLTGDIKAEIDAITLASGDLAMFKNRVDPTRIGLAGHSAGGNGVTKVTDVAGVRVVIPISADAAPTGASVESTLFVSGTADTVVAYSRVSTGYTNASTRSHKRLVGIMGAAHTGVTSLCGIKNTAGKSILEVAKANGVLSGPLALFADNLFDCPKNTTPESEVVPIVNAATAAVLEETLHCDPSATVAIDKIATDFAKVEEYKHAP